MPNPNYRTWEFYADANGYAKRRMKPLSGHPATLELAQDAAFVARARAWAWAQQGPTPRTAEQQATTFPGRSARDWIGEYWVAVFQRKREHDAANYMETTTLEDIVSFAKLWSAQNPTLEY